MDDQAAHRGATVAESEAYKVQRDSAILAQQTEHRRLEEDKQARALALYGDKIGKKQRDKALKQKKAIELSNSDAPTDSSTTLALEERPRLEILTQQFDMFVPELQEGQETTGPPPSQAARVQKPERSRPPISSMPYTVIIQPSSIDMPWYDPDAATVTTLDQARATGLWHYPIDALQQARCNVFEDLWRKGHFMGGGLRFGGDFLVYPGQSRPSSFKR